MWVNVERGWPQGSIAGPFIWNLMMDELLGELSSVVECVANADDLLILVERSTHLKLEQQADEYMCVVNAWSLKVGDAISTDKTVAMMLKGIPRRLPYVKLNGMSLQIRQKVIYLGVTIAE